MSKVLHENCYIAKNILVECYEERCFALPSGCFKMGAYAPDYCKFLMGHKNSQP